MIDPNIILDSRREQNRAFPKFERNEEDAAEGGCGVVGLAWVSSDSNNGTYIYDATPAIFKHTT